jgi:DNA-directed RNA polymerase specialized sigma24 family protein
MSKTRRTEKPSRKSQPLDEIGLLAKAVRLLESLVRLNLIIAKGEHSQTEMIDLLHSGGCGQSEIASLIGTTANTVNVTLHRAKRKTRKK